MFSSLWCDIILFIDNFINCIELCLVKFLVYLGVIDFYSLFIRSSGIVSCSSDYNSCIRVVLVFVVIWNGCDK